MKVVYFCRVKGTQQKKLTHFIQQAATSSYLMMTWSYLFVIHLLIMCY